MPSTEHGIDCLCLSREGPRNAEVAKFHGRLIQVVTSLGILEECILRLYVTVHFSLLVDRAHSRDKLQEYSQVKLHVLRFAAFLGYEIIQVALIHLFLF